MMSTRRKALCTILGFLLAVSGCYECSCARPRRRASGWKKRKPPTVETQAITNIMVLIDIVAALNDQQGIPNNLDTKLNGPWNALGDVYENNDVAAINSLQAFINAVEVQRDNKITDDQADILVSQAQAIIDQLS